MPLDLEATNEEGFAYIDVTMDAAVNLPRPVYGNTVEAARVGQAIRPEHALISVEGGDVRYRLDGTDVIEPMGIPAYSGTFIDWTNPLFTYASFIDRMSVIATRYDEGSTAVRLNISWRT